MVSRDYKEGSNGAKGVGKSISLGVAAGIEAAGVVRKVISAAVSVVTRAIGAAKKKADVNSPSKVMRDEVGAPLAEGVAVGIEQGSGDASAAAVDAVEGAVRAANTTAAKSSIDMSGLVTSIPEAKKAIAANMDQLSAQAKAAVQYEMDRRAASISAYNTFSIPAYDDGRVIALLRELVTETRDGKTIMVGQRVLGRTVRQWEQKMARVTGGA